MTDTTAEFNPSDHFDQLSNLYDQFIGLMTGDVAHYIHDTLIPPPNSSTVVHDNACGTGLVTEHLQTIAAKTNPPTYAKMIHATDFVPSVIEVMKQKSARQGWQNVHVAVMDSQDLTFPNDYFDLSIMNFGIFFLPDPQRGADQIFRTLKPGGTAVVTAWKERRIMDTIVQAQKSIRPDLATLTTPWADSWSEEDTLRTVLVKAGFNAESLRIEEKRTDVVAHAVLRDPEIMRKSYPTVIEGWSDEETQRLGGEILRIARHRDPEGQGVGGLYCVAWIAVARK